MINNNQLILVKTKELGKLGRIGFHIKNLSFIMFVNRKIKSMGPISRGIRDITFNLICVIPFLSKKSFVAVLSNADNGYVTVIRDSHGVQFLLKCASFSVINLKYFVSFTKYNALT